MRFITLFIGVILLSGCAKSWYLGEWVVSDVKFPGISAIGVEEAQHWFGSRAVYSEAIVSFRGEGCSSPEYYIESLSTADFYTIYRASFSQLDIEGEQVDILKVQCDSISPFPGKTLIKASPDTGYVLWDGAFFKLERD